MLVQGIKSRPVYDGLPSIRMPSGTFLHSKVRVHWPCSSRSRRSTPPSRAANPLYGAAGRRGTGALSALAALGADRVWQAPSIETLLFRLKGSLTNATMGTRLYVSGTEGFIGQAMQLALDFGMDFHSIPPSIAARWPGACNASIARAHRQRHRQPVHLQPLRPDIAGARPLFAPARAFQGVNIDAEEPGTAPARRNCSLEHQYGNSRFA
jgi:hypothetical protein